MFSTYPLRRKIILPLLSTLIVFTGLGIATYLVKSSQEIRKQAAAPPIPPTEATPKQTPAFAAGQVVVKFRPGSIVKETVKKNVDTESFTPEDLPTDTTGSGVKNLLQGAKVKTINKIFKASVRKIKAVPNEVDLSNIYLLEVEVPVDQAIFTFGLNPYIEYAEPNYKVQTYGVPNDIYYQDQYPNNISARDPNWNPPYDYQWNLKKIQAQAGWDAPVGQPVLTAVIDSGVDYTHPELGACTTVQVQGGQCPQVAAGYDFVNNDADPMDDNGHGTHVAGIIAALTNNQLGVASLNQSTKVLPIKVMDAGGLGLTSTISQGIYFAVNNNARIINMSLGGSAPTFPQVLKDAMDYASAHQVLMAVAAGNSAAELGPGDFPTSYPAAVTVAATDAQDLRTGFSNFGNRIDVAAPGSEIISLRAGITDIYHDSIHIVGSKYYRASGTSMSAPHVAALAARLLSLNPGFSATDLRNVIANSADKIDQNYFSKYTGYGRINVARALSEKNTGLPLQATIDYPLHDLFGNQVAVPINGTAIGANFDHYVIEWQKDGTTGWSSSNLTLTGNPPGQAPVTANLLGTLTLSPTMFADGRYQLRLKVFDKSQANIAMDDVHIQILQAIKAGWPIHLSTGIQTLGSPALGDVISGSPGPEIVVAASTVQNSVNSGQILVMSKDGAVLKTWTMPNAYTKHTIFTPSPVLAEIDKASPGLEIVIPWWDKLYVFHGDGTPVSGWPKTLPEVTTSSVSVADVNLDGVNEIISATPHQVAVYNASGVMLAGWPKTYPDHPPETYIATPTTGDIDPNYPGLEIAVGANDQINIYHTDGTVVAGWPIRATKTPANFSSLTLAEIDPQLKNGTEVLATTYNYSDYSGSLLVLRNNGTAVSGFPKEISGKPFIAGVSVSDSDSNYSGLEIAVNSVMDTYTGIFHANGTAVSGWPIMATGYTIGNPILTDLYPSSPGNELVVVGNSDPALIIYALTGGKLLTLPAEYGTYTVSPAMGMIDNKKVLVLLSDQGSLMVLEFPNTAVAAAYEWPQFQQNEVHGGSQYSPCAVVANKITTAFVSSCGQAKYDKIADLNKDRSVTILDFSQLAGNQNPALCQTYLNDPRDPCVVPTATPTPKPTPTTTPIPIPSPTATPTPKPTPSPTPKPTPTPTLIPKPTLIKIIQPTN